MSGLYKENTVFNSDFFDSRRLDWGLIVMSHTPALSSRPAVLLAASISPNNNMNHNYSQVFMAASLFK